MGVQKYFSLWCCYYCWYKNKIFIFLFFIYLFVYLFNIKSGDGGHRSHCPFHAKEMLYHLSYIPILLISFLTQTYYNAKSTPFPQTLFLHLIIYCCIQQINYIRSLWYRVKEQIKGKCHVYMLNGAVLFTACSFSAYLFPSGLFVCLFVYLFI